MKVIANALSENNNIENKRVFEWLVDNNPDNWALKDCKHSLINKKFDVFTIDSCDGISGNILSLIQSHLVMRIGMQRIAKADTKLRNELVHNDHFDTEALIKLFQLYIKNCAEDKIIVFFIDNFEYERSEMTKEAMQIINLHRVLNVAFNGKIKFILSAQSEDYLNGPNSDLCKILDRSKWIVRLSGIFLSKEIPSSGKNKVKRFSYNKSTLTVRFGDITTSESDIIVSSDDTALTMGGGASMSIRSKVGPILLQERRKHRSLQVGDVVVTSAGNLNAKYIFHAITCAQCKRTSADKQQEIIDKLVQKSLLLMQTLGVKSIAFPAIGTGAAYFSGSDVAVNMAKSFARFLSPKENDDINIELYLFDREDIDRETDCIDFFADFKAKLKSEELNYQEVNQQVQLSKEDIQCNETIREIERARDIQIANLQAQITVLKLQSELDSINRKMNHNSSLADAILKAEMTDIQARISQTISDCDKHNALNQADIEERNNDVEHKKNMNKIEELKKSI